MAFVQFLVTLWILFLMTSAVQFSMIALKIFGQINWEWIYVCSPFVLFVLFSIFICIFKIIEWIRKKTHDRRKTTKKLVESTSSVDK